MTPESAHRALSKHSVRRQRGYEVLLLALMLLTGCSGTQPFQKPRVSLEGIKLKSADLLSQTFLLSLRIENRNDYTIRLRDIRAELYLGDKRFATGENKTQLAIAKWDSATTQVIAKTKLEVLLVQLAQKHANTRIDYDIRGQYSDNVDENNSRWATFTMRGTRTLELGPKH